jgi:hypothetical protein
MGCQITAHSESIVHPELEFRAMPTGMFYHPFAFPS